MKETDIRPEKELGEYLRLLKKDISLFLDSGGVLRKDLSESGSCRLCSSGENENTITSSSELLFVKDGFTYVKCIKCGLIYLNPRLKPAELEKYHRKSEAMKYFQENILAKTSDKRRPAFRKRVDMIREFASSGRLLDIGSSVGEFLSVAGDSGFHAEGIELHEYACTYAKQRGLTVHNRQLEEIRFPDEAFDIITMWELVAFIPEPLPFLRECARILKKGGFLFLSTPNTEGFEFKILGKAHTNFVGPNHHNLFNAQNIRLLLEKAGFSVLRISTPGILDVDTVRNALKSGAPLQLDGFLKDILLGESDYHSHLREELQKWISAHNLSGHMVAVGKK